VYFRFTVVRKYVLEAFRQDASAGSVPPKLLVAIRQQLHKLAASTLAFVHGGDSRDGSPPSVVMVRNVCQNYLSVESLTRLLCSDLVGARVAALAILRYTLGFPGDVTLAPNVPALSSALKVFMDLGMPDEVERCMRFLDAGSALFSLAAKLLQYARTGERPAATTTAGAAAAAAAPPRLSVPEHLYGDDSPELVLLDSSFRRATVPLDASAAAAAAEAAAAAAAQWGLPDIVRLEDVIDWRRVLGARARGATLAAMETPPIVNDVRAAAVPVPSLPPLPPPEPLLLSESIMMPEPAPSAPPTPPGGHGSSGVWTEPLWPTTPPSGDSVSTPPWGGISLGWGLGTRPLSDAQPPLSPL
jgi:hypothetical protein